MFYQFLKDIKPFIKVGSIAKNLMPSGTWDCSLKRKSISKQNQIEYLNQLLNQLNDLRQKTIELREYLLKN